MLASVTSVELSVPAASTPNVVLAVDAFASSTNVLPNADIVVLAGKEKVLISASTLPTVKISFSEPFAPAFQ